MKISMKDITTIKAGNSDLVVYVYVNGKHIKANKYHIVETLIAFGYEFTEFVVEYHNDKTGEISRRLRDNIGATLDAANFPPKDHHFINWYFPGCAPAWSNVKINYLDD